MVAEYTANKIPHKKVSVLRPSTAIKGVRYVVTRNSTEVLDDLIDPNGQVNNKFVAIPPHTIVDLYELLSNYHIEIATEAADLSAKAESLTIEKETATASLDDPAKINEVEERIDNEMDKLELALKRKMDVAIKISKSLRRAIETGRIKVLPNDFDIETQTVELEDDLLELPQHPGGTVRCPYSVYEERYNKEVRSIKEAADKEKAEPFAPTYAPR